MALIGVAFVSPARADVALTVSAAIEESEPGIFHPNDGARGRGRIVREYETTVEANVGQTLVLCMPRGASGDAYLADSARGLCTFDAASGYALLLRVERVRDGEALVTMHAIDDGADVENAPATAIPIRSGQTAAMLGSPPPYHAGAETEVDEVLRLTVGASGED